MARCAARHQIIVGSREIVFEREFDVVKLIPAFSVLVAIANGLTSVALAQPAAVVAQQPAATTERIVIMRHGEKPEAGLGQLACRGLARAIALPDVIVAKFGAPNYLFAPNPSRRKPDRGTPYDYIRPLATLEPMAIKLGLPVDVQHGFDRPKRIVREVLNVKYVKAVVVVAWEHRIAPDITRGILKTVGGDISHVARWNDDDFDRLDVIDITRTPGQPVQATYTVDRQGLNGIAGDCPKPPAQ